MRRRFPVPLGEIGARAQKLLDRIDVAEAADLPSIAVDAKAAKDTGELTASEAATLQRAYGAKARELRG